MNLKESIRRVLREDRYKGYKRFLKDNVFTDLPEYIINDMFRESGDLDYSQVQGMTKNQIIDYFFNGDGKKYFDRWGEYKGKKQKVVKIEWDDLTEPLQIFLKNKMSGKDPNLSDTRKKIDKMIEMEPNLGNGNNEPIQLKYNEKGKIEDITGGNHRTYAAFEINDFNPILMNAYIDDSKTTLQESIRRILMETVNGSTFFRRRVDISSIDEEFYKNLNIVTDRFLMLSSNKQSYSFNEFRTTVISYLIDDYRDNLSDEDYDNLPYDEVYDFLLNYFYDKIKDRYDTMFGDDLQESIRRILREERQLSNFLRRRLDMLDYEVERGLNGPFGGGNICLFFKSDIEYFESIMENSIDAMYYNHFSHIDDNSGEWAHAYLDMVDYIRKKYKSKIMKHYDDNCGSGLIPLKESIKRVLREDTDEYRENVRVKISDIQPTNRDGQSIEDAIINVKDGLTSYSQDPPFLLKRGDKYEILDGFHRIAQKILDGKKYVTSDVMIQEHIRKVVREERTDPKENPVKYYYYNYLNENPIEFEGLFLVPKWTGLHIKWKVENPNDYSYSKSVLTQVLDEEFKSFCDMTNTNFNKYKHFASWMKNIRNNCYVSEEDRKRLNDNGKQIKHIDFSGIRHRYEFDFNYETTHVTTSDPEVEVYVYGNITNLIKTDIQDNLEQTLKKVNPRHFISDMTESDYDEWKEELHNILHSMYNIFVNNPRFYNNDYDYFELGLQQTP